MSSSLTLSALLIRTSTRFPATVLPYTRETLDATRRRADLCVHHRTYGRLAGKLLVVALEPRATGLPAPQWLDTHQNLALIAQLIEQRMPDLAPELALTRDGHAFDHVRTGVDIFAESIARAGVPRTPPLALLHSYVKARFGVRYEYLDTYGTTLLLTIDLRRTYACDATVADLVQHGIAPADLGVLDRTDLRYLGSVHAITTSGVVIDTPQGQLVRDPDTCRLNPAMATFARFLEHAFPEHERARIHAAEKEIEAEHLAGPGHLDTLRHFADYFEKLGTRTLAPDVSISFGELIAPTSIELPPIQFSFARDGAIREPNPVRGVEQHGPRDALQFATGRPRLAFVFPKDRHEAVESFARHLLGDSSTHDDTGYAGIRSIFGLVGASASFHPVEDGAWPAAGYVDAVCTLRDTPDLVFVVVEDEQADARDSPYSATMTRLWERRIPTHRVRNSKLHASRDRIRFVLEDIGITAYVKLGGTPWTLAGPRDPNELVIGLGYASPRWTGGAKKRFRAIATVFASDGRFIGSAYSAPCNKDEYPDALASMLAGALDAASTSPSSLRTIVHAWPALTDEDLPAVAAVLHGSPFALLTLRADHPFKLFDAREPTYVPARGVMIDLGRSKKALCVHGHTLLEHERGEHPAPLLIDLAEPSTLKDLHAHTQQLFRFTGIYGGAMHTLREPVTLYYVRLLAKQLARLDGTGSTHPFTSTRFEAIPWFL